MVIGRFFYIAYVKRNTYYFVTNLRVLIIKNIRNPQTTALYLTKLDTIAKKVNSNGSGSIRFGRRAIVNGIYANTGLEFWTRQSTWTWYRPIPPTFYYLEDANLVYNLICNAKANASSVIIESIAHK